MKNDKSWRGMLLKDNEGDWGVAVAAWRGLKKGQAGVPGKGPRKKNPGIRGKTSNEDTGPEFLFASLKPETS